MVLAPAMFCDTKSEWGEMDMYTERGLTVAVTALSSLGAESGHPELTIAKLIVLRFLADRCVLRPSCGVCA